MGVIYKSVEVEFDLSDLSDEELIEELRDRGVEAEGSVSLEDIRHALATRRREEALEMMRSYIQDKFGCVLP